MCELFGSSSDRPVQPKTLLCRLGARGGAAADNPDGWGLAMLDGSRLRLLKEARPAAHSARFRALCTRSCSSLMLRHVRKANPPTARRLANTHPFRRRCRGREWIFAHNGILPDADLPAGAGPRAPFTSLPEVGPPAGPVCATPPPAHRSWACVPDARFTTPSIGDTDSEQAFCAVLDGIATAFAAALTGSGRYWLDTLAAVAEILASRERFNFLMSDGDHLIAYGHDRLHGLAGAGQVVVATEPLTADPDWFAFVPGELRVYRRGVQIARIETHPCPAIVMLPGDIVTRPARS